MGRWRQLLDRPRAGGVSASWPARPVAGSRRRRRLGLATLAVVLVLVAIRSALRAGDDQSSPSQAAPAGPPASAQDRLELSVAIRKKGEKASHLYLVGEDGAALRRLERIRGDKQDPDWSADGSRVVFRWLPRGDYSYTPIIRMNADGSHLANLSKVSGLVGWSPSWSPDGKRRVAAARRSGGKLSLFTMAPDGTRVRLIFSPEREAQYPAWSPDGRSIAFTQVTTYAGFDLYSIRPDGTGLRRLTTDGRSNWAMWSPDSRLIAWGKEGPSGGEIWLMRRDGSQKRVLTRRWNPGVPGAWEPGRLVFQCIRPGSGVISLCSIRADGTGFVSLLNGREAGFPAWRPVR